jgi:hypothetical protein
LIRLPPIIRELFRGDEPAVVVRRGPESFQDAQRSAARAAYLSDLKSTAGAPARPVHGDTQ